MHNVQWCWFYRVFLQVFFRPTMLTSAHIYPRKRVLLLFLSISILQKCRIVENKMCLRRSGFIEVLTWLVLLYPKHFSQAYWCVDCYNSFLGWCWKIQYFNIIQLIYWNSLLQSSVYSLQCTKKTAHLMQCPGGLSGRALPAPLEHNVLRTRTLSTCFL